jgi:hypothetical protein
LSSSWGFVGFSFYWFWVFWAGLYKQQQQQQQQHNATLEGMANGPFPIVLPIPLVVVGSSGHAGARITTTKSSQQRGVHQSFALLIIIIRET